MGFPVFNRVYAIFYVDGRGYKPRLQRSRVDGRGYKPRLQWDGGGHLVDMFHRATGTGFIGKVYHGLSKKARDEMEKREVLTFGISSFP